ncbi:hypothetical protein HRW14_19220 [Streptomyces lunaelactis]|nr:alpha/beta fold hydrolase [Streptomyces lunaelactis]NUK52372.1 hypothetical protein [Streptomyces lunaelactis]NUK65641.1 hypothetical protein [Streptomyces lunaelactis]
MAVDLPGFGHSEGRTELFTPSAMGDFLYALIGEWGLGTPHVLGPDVGTGAALFLAARHPASVASSRPSVAVTPTGDPAGLPDHHHATRRHLGLLPLAGFDKREL